MAVGTSGRSWPGRLLIAVTAVALVFGGLALVFSVWASLDRSESLGGLWLIFWAIVFVPLFIVLGAIHLWRARRRGIARTEA
jgi:succinate dehydrogenase hydrophobic anchor subunit